MVGNVPKLTQIQSCSTTSTTTEEYTLYIPLRFWYNRHPGLALPIISLQHHDVKLNVKLRNLDDHYVGQLNRITLLQIVIMRHRSRHIFN